MTRTVVLLAASTLLASSAPAQTPQPFPRQRVPATSAPTPQGAAPATPAARPVATDAAGPTEAMLGFPIFPGAQFIASYDAGRSQRYFIFGTTASFAELVSYYKTALKERGNQVFDEPLTHMFEVGRFREETMAFPPGVTIKDWTSSGSGGYPNPTPGAQPARYPTIIMIVPSPPGEARK